VRRTPSQADGEGRDQALVRLAGIGRARDCCGKAGVLADDPMPFCLRDDRLGFRQVVARLDEEERGVVPYSGVLGDGNQDLVETALRAALADDLKVVACYREAARERAGLLVDLAKKRLILPDSSLPLVHADEEYDLGPDLARP